MQITAEIRRLSNLMDRNATPGQEITWEELREAQQIASRLPQSRQKKCWVCWGKKDPAVVGVGLCHGHIRLVLVTGK